MTLQPNLGACGDDCAACPRYQATQSGDPERLRAVADLWRRAGWRDTVVSPEEIACGGCATAVSCRYGIRHYAREKGVANCGLCADYPCAKILEAFAATAASAGKCRENCTAEDYLQLEKAFFFKQENLERQPGLGPRNPGLYFPRMKPK